MVTILIILGILLIGAAGFLLVTAFTVQTEDITETKKDPYDGRKVTRIVKRKSEDLQLSIAKRKMSWWIMAGVGVVFLVLQAFMFYVRPGHQYYVISPTGAKSVLTQSGYKLITPFSRIQEWQKIMDVKTVIGDESTEGIEGVMGQIPIRFIDQVTAGVRISCRFQLPTDPKSFMKIAEDFRHPMNLVNNTLIPTVREQVINTGYMFKAQDYISGSAADFRVTLDEQLKDGGYSIERTESKDTVYNEISNTQTQRSIRGISTTYNVKKRTDRNGVPLRVEHDITKNKIIVAQVIVDQVVLEDKFKLRLEEQRDISAKKRIEIQKAETAKSAQQRIVAEGERDKAAERVDQEKNQIKILIAIETKVKEEESNRQLALIALKTKKLLADGVKVIADAEAYKNRKLVIAGLTPQERAEYALKTEIGVAKALAGPSGITFPSTYFSAGGSSKGGSTDMLSQLMTMMLAKDLQKPKK